MLRRRTGRKLEASDLTATLIFHGAKSESETFTAGADNGTGISSHCWKFVWRKKSGFIRGNRKDSRCSGAGNVLTGGNG